MEKTFFNEVEIVNCEVYKVIVHWLMIYVSRETFLVANIIYL